MKKEKKNKAPENSLSYTKQLKWNKQEKAFWTKYFNNPPEPEAIPTHSNYLSFRSSDITDEEIGFLVNRITSIEQLDLDDAYITKEAIKHLTRLQHIGELRLKGCTELYDDCVPYLVQLKGLKLLHLVGTNITLGGLINMQYLADLEKLFLYVNISEDISAKMLELKAQLPICSFYI